MRAHLSSLALVALLAPAAVAQFQVGDLYVYSNGVYPSLPTSTAGIVRIDPFTGASQPLGDPFRIFPVGGNNFTYDAPRDRLVFSGAYTDETVDLWEMDSNGVRTPIPGFLGKKVSDLSSAGDGRIFLHISGGPPVSGFDWLDASNVRHQLLGPDGITPYDFDPAFAGYFVRAILYHPGVNALFLVTSSSVGGLCAGGSSLDMNVHKLSLSADGTRVESESCTQFNVNPAGLGELPESLAIGPNGNVLIHCDVNNNTMLLPRMFLVNPVTLATSVYAHSSGIRHHTGTYSRLLDRAVVFFSVDDTLRLFGLGGTGGGTVLQASVSPAPYTAEHAVMIEIDSGPTTWGLSANVPTISLASGGTQVLSHDYGAAFAGDVYWLFGSLSGTTPGFDSGGFHVPLNFDSWFLFTVNSPGAPPYTGGLGLLDANGRATSALTLPPLDPSLAGASVHHAAAVWSPVTLQTVHVSNATRVELQ